MYSKLDNFAEWLRHELAERKLSVSKLAKISNVHPNTIRNYLARRCEPTFYNVVCIVNSLGYDVEAVSR